MIPEYQRRRSHSQLTAYEECPRKFFHLRVEEHPEGGSWWNVGGTAVHGAIEDAENHDLDVTAAQLRFFLHFAEGIDRQVEAQGDSKHWRAAKKGAEDGAWWATAGPKMIATYFETRHPASRVLDVELAFEVDVEGVLFRGFIDQVRVTAYDEIEIHDLKTGAMPTTVDQLAEYMYALDMCDAPADRVVYNNLRTGKMRAWERAEAEAAYPRERFVERLHAMDRDEKAGRYPPKSSYACSFCPVWHLCGGIGKPVAPSTMDR